MKIETARISAIPCYLREDIDVSGWDMDSEDVHFDGKLALECDFVLAGKEILVDCSASFSRLIVCSRCLEKSKQPVRRKFSLNYDSTKIGDHLQIDADVREELLLTFPMKVLCKEDCRGLCPVCGTDLNREECDCRKDERGLAKPAPKEEKFKIKVAGTKSPYKKQQPRNKKE